MAWIVIACYAGLNMHGNAIFPHLQVISIIQAHGGVASQRQVMAIDVGCSALVGDAEAAFLPTDLAMLRAYAGGAIM
ncbi:hypothetical protein D3C81_1541350 [compost metagenome]